MARLYDADVAYQDQIVGELIDILDDADLLDNTWVVITSDHGELFGEWDMVYHTAGAHYQLLHVPLIVRPPGGVEAQRVDALVQPVDVFMTLALAGGAVIPAGVEGTALSVGAYPLPLRADEPSKRTVCFAQTHGASIAGLSVTQRRNLQTDVTRWLRWIDTAYSDGYLLETDSLGQRRLFDVQNDPAMERDLVQQRKDVVNALSEVLENWTASGSGESPSAGNFPVEGEAPVQSGVVGMASRSVDSQTTRR